MAIPGHLSLGKPIVVLSNRRQNLAEVPAHEVNSEFTPSHQISGLPLLLLKISLYKDFFLVLRMEPGHSALRVIDSEPHPWNPVDIIQRKNRSIILEHIGS